MEGRWAVDGRPPKRGYPKPRAWARAIGPALRNPREKSDERRSRLSLVDRLSPAERRLLTNAGILAFGWTGYWQVQALVLTVIGLPFVIYVALRQAD